MLHGLEDARLLLHQTPGQLTAKVGQSGHWANWPPELKAQRAAGSCMHTRKNAFSRKHHEGFFV